MYFNVNDTNANWQGNGGSDIKEIVGFYHIKNETMTLLRPDECSCSTTHLTASYPRLLRSSFFRNGEAWGTRLAIATVSL